MKKVLKQMKHLECLIKETESEIMVISELPFYSQFRRESERESEISKLNESLRDYQSQKLVLLENLETEIAKAKMSISSKLRELSLLKTAV